MKISKVFLCALILFSCTKQQEQPKHDDRILVSDAQISRSATGTIIKACITQGVTHRVKFKANHVAGNNVTLGVYEMNGDPILVKPVSQDGKQFYLFTFSEGLRCDVQYMLISNGSVLSQANATCIMCGN